MKEVELVIKIPEEVKQTFDNAKDEDLYGNYYDYNSLIGKAIQNGIQLPEGHGRLIDADALIKDVRDNSESYFADDFAHEWVDVAPTIIEADRSEES